MNLYERPQRKSTIVILIGVLVLVLVFCIIFLTRSTGKEETKDQTSTDVTVEIIRTSEEQTEETIIEEIETSEQTSEEPLTSTEETIEPSGVVETTEGTIIEEIETSEQTSEEPLTSTEETIEEPSGVVETTEETTIEETIPPTTQVTTAATTEAVKENPTLGNLTPTEEVKEKELVVGSEFSRFSGQFVEDGRDELVENVAAILVTNTSDQFLDLATLQYDIDGKTATFIATGLPAGQSAWVMETSRMVINSNAEFTYLGCATAYKDGVIASTNKVTITSDGNMLTAMNNTQETLESVFVYYKVLHTDGNYFGGITYLVDFGTLKPGESIEKLAGHYVEGKTEIVRIGWQTN